METKMIFKQMSKVMKDIGAIGKTQKNTMQGFNFRGVDAFVNALYPALLNHSVFMVPKCISESHELRNVIRGSGKESVDKYVHLMMEYTFFAEDGSSVTIGPIPSEGIDSGDKATNKALSAALKYALIQTFSIPTVDMVDGDSESIEIAPETMKKSELSDNLKTDNPAKKTTWGSKKHKKTEETSEVKTEDLF